MQKTERTDQARFEQAVVVVSKKERGYFGGHPEMTFVTTFRKKGGNDYDSFLSKFFLKK